MERTVTRIEALPQIIRRLNVAAYARVSSAKDAMKQSLSAQVSYYSAYIQRHIEWQFSGVYIDDAVTGTKDDRSDFQRLIDDCRAGKIDLIVTKSVTRFARNTLTTLQVVRELKDIGVDVYFENEHIHSISTEGELMLTQHANYAQADSRVASTNMKWRIQRKFKKGQTTVTRMLGYRLVDNVLQVVPEEAEVVQQIFADYLSGLGVWAICKKLNSIGFPTMHGGPWIDSAIWRILENEKYLGEMLLQKTFSRDHLSKKKCVNRGELPLYHITNSHEPIISHEIFDQVRQERTRRVEKYHPSKKAPEKYPFTGRILCGGCGKYYRRKHTNAGGKYEKIVWICGTFNTHGKTACDAQQIPENIIFAKTAEILGLPAFDEAVFNAKVKEIRVPSPGKLIFVFRDGICVEADWQNPSRREVWTEVMKQVARDRQNKILEERKRK